ncbi:MAG: hypothetical protein ACI9UQ_000615 [Candidatus Krumholzibacteriia bacterium]|jgi:hypothetical protein
MSSPTREIGGYFELEPGSDRLGTDAPHLGPDAVRLNSGRNALRAALMASGAKRIHLPDYLCESVVQTVRMAGVEPVFHHLDDQLQPAVDIACDQDELWLSVNYFGLMDAAMSEAAHQTDRLVVDNCQAFYAAPLAGVINLYSPRKFFGVPDGGYVVGIAAGDWSSDNSQDRMKHLFLRAEQGAEAGYAAFQDHEQIFADLPVRSMSPLTQTLLATVDYAAAAEQRLENYRLLNDKLGADNQLSIAVNHDGNGVPLVYPFVNEAEGLRAKLHRHDIFAASYWPGCLQRPECGRQARNLARNLTALPIDQRYNAQDMDQIARAVREHLAGNRVRLVVS